MSSELKIHSAGKQYQPLPMRSRFLSHRSRRLVVTEGLVGVFLTLIRKKKKIIIIKNQQSKV